MKAIIFIALIAFSLNSRAINRKFVEHLKKHAPFQVYEVEENPFRDWTDEELKARLGTIKEPSPIHRDGDGDIVIDTPYDFRKEHPKCLTGVRDQANCGSCYAFGSVTAFQYRYCMKSGDQMTTELAPQDPLSCDMNQLGCHGGYLDKAWDYLYHDGVVEESCFPYSAADGKVEFCITKCKNGQKWKKYFSNWTDFFGHPTYIIDEIPKNGPVNCQMDIYQDFYDYKGGIYEYTSGDLTGGHSIVIVGFGVEDGKNYWIVQNSWGPNWGESGYFRIKMFEAGIDEKCWGGGPAL